MPVETKLVLLEESWIQLVAYHAYLYIGSFLWGTVLEPRKGNVRVLVHFNSTVNIVFLKSQKTSNFSTFIFTSPMIFSAQTNRACSMYLVRCTLLWSSWALTIAQLSYNMWQQRELSCTANNSQECTHHGLIHLLRYMFFRNCLSLLMKPLILQLVTNSSPTSFL